ncbi:alpha-hydroxy acid oxidase [Pseudoxanthomonas putridarboris]|uniref:Alpha-hydroxy acid oxidase n=1 Tax=Pseudoxanthomonas putridarboris TaxID=752605 RepID=A0ABU9J627_9GAMM
MTPLPPLAQIPPQIAAVADYETYARERMSPAAWAYFSGGAADELTLRDNVEAFQRLKLQGRVLREVVGGDTRLSLLGEEFDYPILLAPVAFQTLAHRDGELAAVVGASAMKAGMVVSTQSGITLEEIAQAAQTRLWFQLYLQPDRDFTAELAKRAEAAGYRALVVTVDAPVNGARNREQRAGFALPAGVEAANLRGLHVPPQTATAGGSPLFGTALLDHAPTWRDVAWLRSTTSLPIVLKGVMSADDAAAAVEAGAAGVIVSNHGGRTLDTLPATIDALPAVVRAVDGRIPVLLDGGIRRGTDVLKALALGADAVLVGRPYVHALASAGAVGVAHVLHLLRAELEMAMALTGCRTLADIDRGILWNPPPL